MYGEIFAMRGLPTFLTNSGMNSAVMIGRLSLPGRAAGDARFATDDSEAERDVDKWVKGGSVASAK
jgi:hypothetical protein